MKKTPDRKLYRVQADWFRGLSADGSLYERRIVPAGTFAAAQRRAIRLMKRDRRVDKVEVWHARRGGPLVTYLPANEEGPRVLRVVHHATDDVDYLRLDGGALK